MNAERGLQRQYQQLAWTRVARSKCAIPHYSLMLKAQLHEHDMLYTHFAPTPNPDLLTLGEMLGSDLVNLPTSFATDDSARIICSCTGDCNQPVVQHILRSAGKLSSCDLVPFYIGMPTCCTACSCSGVWPSGFTMDLTQCFRTMHYMRHTTSSAKHHIFTKLDVIVNINKQWVGLIHFNESNKSHKWTTCFISSVRRRQCSIVLWTFQSANLWRRTNEIFPLLSYERDTFITLFFSSLRCDFTSSISVSQRTWPPSLLKLDSRIRWATHP